MHMITADILASKGDKPRPAQISPASKYPRQRGVPISTQAARKLLGDIEVGTEDRAWARRELGQPPASAEPAMPSAAEASAAPAPKSPAAPAPKSPAPALPGGLISTGSLPQLGGLRNVRAVNKVAAEHHASRLKRARDNIPPLVGSWGPGKGLPLSPRRPGSPTAASGGSPRFPTHSQSLASLGSFRSASWRSPREFEWEPHGPSVSDEYAATTISRAIHVWERKTAVQQPVWYDSDLPPREPQIENDPYRPPTRPQTPMGSVGGSTVVDPLNSSLRPLTGSGTLTRLEPSPSHPLTLSPLSLSHPRSTPAACRYACGRWWRRMRARPRGFVSMPIAKDTFGRARSPSPLDSAAVMTKLAHQGGRTCPRSFAWCT